MEREEIKKNLIGDLLKCSYCGFCEHVCPTLYVKNNFRVYGPRGRINIMLIVLREGIWSEAVSDSIYTCLLCKACTFECPAGVKIEKDIRIFRHLIRLGDFIK